MPTANFKVGEMLPKRSPNSKTWMNFDGSYTTEIYQGVVHFEDQHGNLQNINTDLYDEADFDLIDEPVAAEGAERFKQAKMEAKAAKKQNVMNRSQHNFQALRVPFDAHIPRNFQRGYTIGKGQDKLTFKPVKSSPSMGELSQTDRSIVVYQDVWNDTDVELQVQPDRLKETIHLKTSKAPTSFSFEVKGKDIADDFTAGDLKLMPAWLVDAAGTERDVDQVVVRGNDNKMYVELKADVTDLIYPIAIDPTVVIQPASANDFLDATIYPTNPTLNRGDYDSLVVQSGTYESLFQFNITGVPTGAGVTSAVLHLYGSSEASTTNMAIDFHKIISSWSEYGVTYNTRPEIEATPFLSIANGRSASGVLYEFDIKPVVKEWVSGSSPNYGIYMKNPVYIYNQYKSFRNTETGGASPTTYPKIVLSYNLPPSAPTVVSPNGGEAWNSLHALSWNAATDPTESVGKETLYDGSLALTNAIGTQSKLAQIFTAPTGITTFKGAAIQIMNPVDNTSNIRVSIYEVGADGNPSMELAGAVEVKSAATLMANMNVPIVAGTQYALVYASTLSSGANLNFRYYSKADNFSGTAKAFSYGSGSWAYNYGGELSVRMDFGNEKLQYQIQLSTDNAVNWKTILGLTNAGSTSHNYDFINEPETSTAKVRIRAYDGTSYGPWDESDGVFTIVHNQAPDAPMNLLPSGGQAKDRAQPIRLSWLHNDPNAGDPQSKYDLEWRKQGTVNWTILTNVTPNQYHDLSGLTYGNHEWRVRTYDQAGLPSPYSDIALFLAADKPSKATLTNYSEGATVAVANPTIQWSSADQAGYKLAVKNSTGTVVWSEEKVSANKALTANANLANQQAYTIELSIRNADGLWSDVTAISVNVSYTPPAIPVMATSGDNQQAAIRLTIANPVPVGTEPAVSHHELFRKASNESDWIRIAHSLPLNGSLTDHTPGSGHEYAYYARSWGENGTYRDSAIVRQTITLSSIWLMDPQDPDSLHRFHYFEPGRSAERIMQGQLMEFEGRAQPMAEFSSREQRKVNVVLQLKKDSTDLDALNDLIGSRTTLLYRDAKGRRIYGTVFTLSENETEYGYTVPLEVQQVGYEEEV